ncbi:hypothetical protein [Thiocapsa sp. N5-Cardenillas]|uniref:hypothetical protein n=1 Tax=Thiocapsa sp. N5-Cardenillas TaxID=3137397 RepID=UPI0035B0E8F0
MNWTVEQIKQVETVLRWVATDVRELLGLDDMPLYDEDESSNLGEAAAMVRLATELIGAERDGPEGETNIDPDPGTEAQPLKSGPEYEDCSVASDLAFDAARERGLR